MDGVMAAAQLVALFGQVVLILVVLLVALAVLLILRRFKVSWRWTIISATTTLAAMSFIVMWFLGSIFFN